MTPEIEKKRRELFDVWYAEYTARGWDVSRVATWTAFNAALDAVEIERPAIYKLEGCNYHDAEAFEESIEATGLGLKVK